MKKQMDSLQEKKTWILVKKPRKGIILDNRWVYNKKYLVGKDPIARARLVIRGD